jgi:hypothetical protein
VRGRLSLENALAELIAEGVSSITDLTPFDLARLQPLDQSLLRSG